MKLPGQQGQEFQPHQPPALQRAINWVMRHAVNDGQITEIPPQISVDPSHRLVVDPTDVWGLKSDEQATGAEDAIREGLPPSQEVFKDMLKRGDSGAIISALEAASRTLIARSEAATDAAIRELRESGASEEEIQSALRESGWELTEFGAHPIGRGRQNQEFVKETIAHRPKHKENVVIRVGVKSAPHKDR